MQLFQVSLILAAAAGIHAQFFPGQPACSWNLIGDDCICMNSPNGALLTQQTNECCRNMGLRTNIRGICHVDNADRQTFKDCCKWLNQEGVIGHCR